MDKKTKQFYDENADEISKFHNSLAPEQLYNLAKIYFSKGQSTIDLGCGAGRDTDWLNTNEYPAVGIDNSEGMLNVARKAFPKIKFLNDELSTLKTLAESSYSNVFCSAAIQHIPRENLLESIRNILRVTKENGRIILSFRGTNSEDMREEGKLYENYQIGQMSSLFESFGAKVIFEESKKDEKRNLTWNTIVVEKKTDDKKSGIGRIQDIIQRDSKTSTYKFALIRAFCEISRYEPHVVAWSRENDIVLIPVKRVAIRWLHYYFPLLKANVRQTTNARLKFEEALKSLDYKASDYQLFIKELEVNSELKKILKLVGETIVKGPVTYSGTKDSPHFGFMSKLDASLYPEMKESEFGMIAVPLSIWRDINNYSMWIEDSLLLQWAQMTSNLNNSNNLTHFFELHAKNYIVPERKTYEIHKLLKNTRPRCVWSNLEIKEMAVDHMIPWTIWHNNDLWNLLPSEAKVNLKKSDKLPHPKRIEDSFDRIKVFWTLYAENFEELFSRQIYYSLGISPKEAVSSLGKDALIHNVERIHVKFGINYWDV